MLLHIGSGAQGTNDVTSPVTTTTDMNQDDSPL
jgi:hypothetical protein